MESDGRKLTLRAIEPGVDGRKANRTLGGYVDLHMLDALPEAVIITRATREIRTANKLACESLRCTREELVGRSLDELIVQQMRPMEGGDDRTIRYDEWSFLLQLGDGKRRLFDVREARLSLGGETCLAYTLRPAALLTSSAIPVDQSLPRSGDTWAASVDAVRQTRGQLRSLFDNAPLGYQVLDGAGRFLDVNQTWLDMFTCTRDEITGRRFADMMPQPFAARFHEFYERLKGGETLLTTEVDVATDTARTMTIAVEGKIERDAVGGFRCGHFTVRDITASKRVEAELRQSRESYKHLADSISDVFLALDDGLVVRYWNRTAETLSERPSAEVVGRHVFDVLPSLKDTDVERLCREALGTQQPVTRILVIPHDEEDRYYESTAYPAGAWLTVIARNVTESRRAERDLRESEERFRTAFQTAPDAVNLNRLDDGLYVGVNEGFTELTGYAPEDVVGKSSLELNIWHIPEDRERLTDALREHGQVRNLEAPFRMKDGSVRTGLMSARVVPIDGVPHVLSITRDITAERRALDALRESEERFRTVFLTSPEGMLIDRMSDGVLIDVNLGFTALTGFERDDVVGRTSRDLRLWCDERDRDRALNGLMSDGSIANLQIRFRLKNGGTRIGLLSARIITLHGEPHTLSAIRDITDREGVREALAHSEERFRHLFDSLHSCLITVVASDEGREFLIRDINEAGEQMNGVLKADIVGRSITEALPVCRSLDLVALLREVDRKGQPVGLPLFHCDDGRMSWWAEGYVYRLPSREIVLIIDDVSARVRTAGALEASERMYRSLVETMIEGLAARDDRQNLTYVNDSFCAMVGYTRDELSGMNMTQLLDSRNVTVFRDQLETQLGGGGQSYELQLTRKDGRTVTTIVSPTRIRDTDGEETRAFAVYTDITERKQAEERLRQATMELDREHLSLQDKNTALKEILAHLEDDKLAFRESLIAELAGAVSPELEQLRHKVTGELRRDVEGVEDGLKRILATHVDPFRTRYANLSAREAQVCDMIVSGLSSKEISEQLNLSPLTVHKHRESIRKKLGLQGKDVNLSTFLRAH